MFFPEFKSDFQAVLEQCKGRKVAVAGHLRPDGDCIGSQVAMVRLLRSQGIDAIAVNGDLAPEALKDFVVDTPLLLPEDLPEGVDWFHIAVDCADEERSGKRVQARLGSAAIVIDHHVSNTRFGKLNIVSDHSAATAEMLAGMAMDAKLPIDAIAAQALYVGIATDTGQFRFPSTTPQVFEISSALIACGANPSEAAMSLYDNEPISKLRLLKAFLESLKLEFDGRVCIGTLTQEIFRQTGANSEETEGIVDYARCIRGVDIGLLIEERENGTVKGSFRAKEGKYRVDQLAKAIGGGGHACAAGFLYEGTMQQLYPKLLELIQERLSELETK